jgi:peptidoglycan/xylan/chitin deacetylase (PgdA/CDA1 family)
MRARLKRLFETALRFGGPAYLARQRLGPEPLILAYHNILPDDAEPGYDRSLHLARSTFAAQLNVLQDTCEVIPLDRALESTPADRPQVVVTFDDAYQGAVTVGLEELVRRGLPATYFVAPGFVGGKAFWWDMLAARGASVLSDSLRDHALDVERGDTERVRAWAVSQGMELGEPGRAARCATEEELRECANQTGMTVGSHTWSHFNLTNLADAELNNELERPLHWLRERFSRVSSWLSYPYGLTSPRVEKAARDVGYSAAVRVSGGRMNLGSANRYAIPRLNVPAGLSLDGFRLRLAGLFCH